MDLEETIAVAWLPLAAVAFLLVQSSTTGSLHAAALKGADIRVSGEGFTLTSDMPPPPDYDEVMKEELEAALNEGTSTALIRFIARHPDHPLADRARSLLSDRDGLDRSVSPTDPDADIYAAFDRAQRQNTVAAFRNFIALHPRHPLTAEARKQIARLQHGNK